MTHTTLGDRWIYDGCHDPVYATALATTILTGGREADLFTATEAGLIRDVTTTHVRGSGSTPVADLPARTAPVVGHEGTATRIDVGVRLVLLRVPVGEAAGSTLTGTWPGQEFPLVLAAIG